MVAGGVPAGGVVAGGVAGGVVAGGVSTGGVVVGGGSTGGVLPPPPPPPPLVLSLGSTTLGGSISSLLPNLSMNVPSGNCSASFVSSEVDPPGSIWLLLSPYSVT